MIRQLKSFLFDEFENSWALRWTGSLLALTHLLSFYFWSVNGNRLSQYLRGFERLCWSFFPSCETQGLGSALIPLIFNLWLLLALMALVFFPWKKTWRLGWLALLLATTAKVLIFVQDYRFMGNYHYMPFWFTAAFYLGMPRRQILPLLLILFYVGAGLIKINTEWLSGAAMIREPWLSGKALELACAAVLFLELIFVWGLLDSRKFWRFFVLISLFAFHAFSWHIVNYFYPLTMACLITAVVLLRTEDSWINRLQAPWAWLRSVGGGICALFLFLQLFPLLLYPDSPLTGEGRLWSLNMLDSRARCDSALVLGKDNTWVEVEMRKIGLGYRIHCDPLVFANQVRKVCTEANAKEEGVQALFRLASRRTTDASSIIPLQSDQICESPPRFDVLGRIEQ